MAGVRTREHVVAEIALQRSNATAWLPGCDEYAACHDRINTLLDELRWYDGDQA